MIVADYRCAACAHEWSKEIRGGAPANAETHPDECPACGSRYFEWANYDELARANKRGFGHD